MFLMQILKVLLTPLVWFFAIDNGWRNYEGHINYRVYDTDGSMKEWQYGKENFSSLSCPSTGSLSFILTGWSEDTKTAWWPILVSNLQTYRGGCVVVVDYWYYTDQLNYADVLGSYEEIKSALVKEVKEFMNHGFSAANIFIFGFSLGAQLALGTGRSLFELNGEKVGRIDVCEPTSVGFKSTPDSKLSAVNVQCIHSNSAGLGTSKRDCHQDWNMGNCGATQVAAKAPPMGSHGLCPYFYNSAFENNFTAIPMPITCSGKTSSYPTDFKMGYLESRFEFTGEFYAATSAAFPYN